jgi:hypothetical protein
MLNQVPAAGPAPESALAVRQVVESAVALARAEGSLVLVHARHVFVRAIGALLACMLATSAAQVTLVLIALSPVLFASSSPTSLLVALIPAVGLTGLGTCLAFLSWRGLGSGTTTVARTP